MHRSKRHVWVSLFDHLVSAQHEPGRDLMADRLRGLEIDDQLKPRRLLDRQIRRLDAAQQLERRRRWSTPRTGTNSVNASCLG
jgi:hypothetical protein